MPDDDERGGSGQWLVVGGREVPPRELIGRGPKGRGSLAFLTARPPPPANWNQGFFSTYFLDFDLLSAVSESGSRV
jgi:hypothetical protein